MAMRPDPSRIGREIERLRRLYASLLREDLAAEPLAAHWTLAGRTLCWHLAFEDVIEPDIDIEIVEPMIIVRARPLGEAPRYYVGMLPVPAAFDAGRPRVRCISGYLQIRVVSSQAKGRA